MTALQGVQHIGIDQVATASDVDQIATRLQIRQYVAVDQTFCLRSQWQGVDQDTAGRDALFQALFTGIAREVRLVQTTRPTMYGIAQTGDDLGNLAANRAQPQHSDWPLAAVDRAVGFPLSFTRLFLVGLNAA